MLKQGKPVHDYDSTTLIHPEDEYHISPPFAIVVDGFSEPHSSENPQRFVEEQTLGQLTAKSIIDVFSNSSPTDSLGELLLKSNDLIGIRSTDAKVPFEIARLAGATFAAADIREYRTEIVTTGDAFALIAFRDGKVILTTNQVRLHDTEMTRTILFLMHDIAKEWGIQTATPEQLQKIRKEMWNRFYPTLKGAREETINNPVNANGYGVLNGDSGERVEGMWQKSTFVTPDIESLLLFTDGLVDWKFLENMEHHQLATFLYEMFKRSGIQGILNFTRSAEISRATESHVTHAEATAIPFTAE